MNKFLTGILAMLCAACLLAAPVAALTWDEAKILESDASVLAALPDGPAIQSALNAWVSYRTIRYMHPDTAQPDWLDKTVYAFDNAQAVSMASQFSEEGWRISDAVGTYTVKAIVSFSEAEVTLLIHEFTYMRYMENGADDFFGIGNQHCLTLQKGTAVWQVTADAYFDTVTLQASPAFQGSGDVNLDGVVDTTDARPVLQQAVGKTDFSLAALTVADVNQDGRVDTTDARLILQKAIGKIVVFPTV